MLLYKVSRNWNKKKEIKVEDSEIEG
jgi:hypothetical protein